MVEQNYTLSLENNPIYQELLNQWPEYHKAVVSRYNTYTPEQKALIHEVSKNVIKISEGKIPFIIECFKRTCDCLLVEEIYFRRNGEYRLKTERDAYDQFYSDKNFMKTYLNGLLLSQLFWDNHFRVFDFFINRFVSTVDDESTVLEIGPGHGLYLASVAGRSSARCVGIDISQESIDQTKHTLSVLGYTNKVELVQADITRFEPPELFDSVILSEILEHVEEPHRILNSVTNLLKPEGEVFLNVPICSPAPDHIYLFREEEEVRGLVSSAGLTVVSSSLFPMNGYDLDRAKKAQATISMALVCKKDQQ